MALKPRLWDVPDHLWEQLRLILDAKVPRKTKGRPRANQRRIMDGIIFKIQTGCKWNLIPRVYGSDSTIFRTLQEWLTLGIWEELATVLKDEFPELAQVDWKKQEPVEPEAEGPPR